MAGEWVETTVGEIAPFSYGKGLPEHERKHTGSIPVYGSSGIIGFHDVALTNGPTVVIGRKGTVGTVHYSPTPCWPIDTTFFISGSDRLLVRYLYYLLKSLGLERMNADSAVPGLNRDAAHAQRVLVPQDKAEQRAIAHILGTLDDKIELNRRMSETLEAMARALFKAWFVDFEPVRAKMEGRWQRGQSLPGLPAHLYDLFPDRLVESELGEIPEGWEVAALPELIELNPLRRLRKGEIAPYLDMANMPTQGYAPEAVTERPFGSGTCFINGDTLVARITPSLENGKTAYVDFLGQGQVGWGSTEFIVLRPKPPLPPEFAYCLARSARFRKFAIQSMTGTSGRQHVQLDSLLYFKLPRIPKPIAEAFGRTVNRLFARSSAAIRESRTLAQLRDALLPKLISGKLRVKDAKGLLKERGL